MNSSICFMFTILAITIVQSERLDPGPQTFPDKTPAEPKTQKRETEEIIVYLTPSQIKSLQEGNGYVDSEPAEQAETSQENQEEDEQPQEEEEGFQLGSPDLGSQLEEDNNELPSSIPVDEPSAEELEQFSWLYRPLQDRQFVPSPEDSFAFLRYYPESETQTEATRLETEESEEGNQEVQPEVPQQRYRLVPYEYTTESAPTTTVVPQEEPIRERWLRLLEQNRAQLRKAQENAAAATTTTTDLPQATPESTLARLRFSARYNDQKQAIANEERLKSIIEKQKALIRAEERANNAPVVVRKEVTITKQTPLIKHVKVHTPILVPIPEPFEVKVPHPFPVPLDLFRPLSAQGSKSKKTEVKKVEDKKSASARTEEKPKSPKKPSSRVEKTKAERRLPADSKKEVSIEVPSRQRSQPERIIIIRHVFEK